MTCLQKFTKLIFTKFTPTSAVNKLHVKIRGNKFHELQIFPRNSRNLLSSKKKRHTVYNRRIFPLPLFGGRKIRLARETYYTTLRNWGRQTCGFSYSCRVLYSNSLVRACHICTFSKEYLYNYSNWSAS